MNEPERHRALDYGHLAMHVAGLVFVLAFCVLVAWLVMSKPNAKLFEADNMVCYSQPLQMQCYPRGR